MTDKHDDIAERLRGLLPYQFQSQPNMISLIDGFAVSGQDMEDQLYRLFNELSIKDAIGEQLDGIGTILGEERGDKGDEDYRASLSVRITINISRGEPETLISVLAAITESTYVQLTELYPARVEMFFNGIVVPADLVANMNRVKAAGIQLTLVGNSSANPFTLAGDPVGAGFNEVGLDIGGELSEVYI